MVDTLAVGLSVLAVIIAIIAIILAFVIPGATGPTGSIDPMGTPGGSNFSGFTTVENGSNLEFIPGMLYNISSATGSTLLVPTSDIEAGDSITFSNNTFGVTSSVKISQDNGGYCTWGESGPLESIELAGVIDVVIVATGNSCDSGTGVEVYILD